MTADYIIKTWAEAKRNEAEAIERGDHEAREFWNNKATFMWAAARADGVTLPSLDAAV